ncbi:hypothetical protein C5E51_28065 [Nocardia nova]|uniref:DUF6879 family protein n=1 Tax=Nocardia nova TaxID=37330 RepID=UPI000CE9D436|nr:hypothetical protein C5E51_28065 [Nocardia nova]
MEFRPTRDLLRQCRTELFRVEVRDTYGVPSEDEPFQRFMNSEPFDYREWFRDWTELVQGLVSKGVSVRRVRVVTVPVVDYQRWSLTEIAPLNIEAGEDIRYLNRAEAGSVPADDYWIIDREIVAFTLSDPDGRAVGGSGVTTDPQILKLSLAEAQRLWSVAAPYGEFHP